jgi:ABC-type oligopeptide transport system ATPase subunit
MSDRIAVMEKGKLIELGASEEVYNHPQNGYTKKLLAAIPRI